MSNIKPEAGTIGWTDLTIINAENVKEFYSKVVGWKAEPLSMGEYNDFVMNTSETKTPVAGICHARGVNANLPAQWLIYINVENLEKSISNCLELGGRLIAETKNMADYGKYCVIQDPAGAVCALFEPIK
jgi:predicted enzyme related to lactoylglutathione lyase